MVPPSWLEECVSGREYLNPKVYKHRFAGSGRSIKDCKVLAADTISSTGFDAEERNFLQRQVEMLGGRFDTQLCRDTCTVLIAKRTDGPKYDSARQWSITVASQVWLLECMVSGARTDPTRFGMSGPAMQGGASQQSGHGAETNLEGSMDMPTQSFSCSQLSQGTQQLSQESGSQCGVKNGAESYLEDQKIFFASDIPSSDRKQLEKLCRAARATTISADPTGLPRSRGVTHIVSGHSELTDELVRIQQSCELWPPCVGAGWVRQCAVELRCVETQHYELKKAPEAIPPPQRKAGLSLMSSESATAKSGGESRVGGQKGLTVNTSLSRINDARGEVVPSSVRTAPSSSGSVAACASSESSHAGGAFLPSSAAADQALAPEEVPETPCSQKTPDSGTGRPEVKRIFDGKVFALVGLSSTDDEMALTKMIKDRGGVLGPTGAACDYEVTPLAQATFGCRALSRLSTSRREVVSEYWVRKCCAVEKVLPPRSHKIYQPLNRTLEIQDAQNAQLCVSGMYGAAKRLVFWLAAQGGMQIQLDLDRRSTTHLITCTQGDVPSEKQRKAEKWTIKVTSLAWLEECVVTGCVRGDVTAFPPGQELDYVPEPRIDPMLQRQADRNAAFMRRTPLTLTVVKSKESPQKASSSAADEALGRIDEGSPTKAICLMAERACAPQPIGRNKPAVHRAGEGENAGVLTPNVSLKKRKNPSDDILVAAGFDFSLYKRTKPSTQNSCALSPVVARSAGQASTDGAAPPQAEQGGRDRKEGIGLASPLQSHQAIAQGEGQGGQQDEDSQSSKRACEVELEAVLQTLQSSNTKATALPVKRRRAAQEEGCGGERGKHWISPTHVSAGVRQGGVGRGSADGVDVTPQTAARGRSSGARGGAGGAAAAAAGRGRRKGRGSPRKMALRGRQIATRNSDEDEDGVGDDDSEDEEADVEYAQGEGQKNLEALMGRVKAAGRAAAKKASATQIAAPAAPLARRSSRTKG